MKYFTVSLYNMRKFGVGKDEIKSILSDFSCPLNGDVEEFIRCKAYDFDRVGLARTNLIYTFSEDDKPILVAFFTIGLSHVVIGDELSKNDKKRIFGTTYPIGGTLKTLLIGQLSKNYKNGNNRYIPGDVLMKIVFERIRKIHQIMPSVVTHIDCKDVFPLRNYYEKFGFHMFKKSDNQLVYLMSTNRIVENTVSIR